MIGAITPTDVLVYFLYPLEDILVSCFSADLFLVFFLMSLALLGIIAVVHIIRNVAIDSFRREVM